MAHRVAPQAEAELDRLWYYVAKESGSIEIADRLIDSITQRFLLLSRNPRLGRRRDEELRPGLRSFPVSEYIILYRIEAEDVLILHVVRAAGTSMRFWGRSKCRIASYCLVETGSLREGSCQERQRPMEKYVLRTDEPESSPRNLWGLRPAASAEDAKDIFRNHITGWYCSSSSKSIQLRRMEEDRARRLREGDFDVELL